MAILVDGNFYKWRAYSLFGEKGPNERAEEMFQYCRRHLHAYSARNDSPPVALYRIFYYDCRPLSDSVYHPLTGKNVNLGKSKEFGWNEEFFKALASKRKVALRMGELQKRGEHYRISDDAVKRLLKHEIEVDDLTEGDFMLNYGQKGVDMRIGLDIASMAYKRQVDKIVLIAGDSDFVPAAKHARREGIDFILDPMWHGIKPQLSEHVDGLHSCCSKEPWLTKEESLCTEEHRKRKAASGDE